MNNLSRVYLALALATLSSLTTACGAEAPVSTSARPAPSITQIPTDQLRGDANTIFDKTTGFSAVLPAGWSIKSATRDAYRTTIVWFDWPAYPEIVARVTYREFQVGEILSPESGISWINGVGPIPAAPQEIEPWLRRFVELYAEQQKKQYPDFRISPDQISPRVVGSRTALVIRGDYTVKGESWVHYVAMLFSEHSKLLPGVRVVAPASRLELIRPACDAFIASIRIP